MKKSRILGLDLIRLFAFALILTYHFDPAFLPAGFLGVDLLFILTGFLVTSSAMDELAETGHFHFIPYIRRRLYRLMPSLLLMMGVSIPLTFFFSQDFQVGIGRQAAASLGCVTNWFEILTGGSYENQFIRHLFLHTWTLAIDVHFYLFWGLLLSLLSKTLPAYSSARYSEERRRNRRLNCFRDRIFNLSLLLFIASVLCMIIGFHRGRSISSLYFSDLSRAFPLFMGAMAAASSGMREVPRSFIRSAERDSALPALSTLVLSGILYLLASRFLSYENQWTYRLAMPLLSLFGGLSVYYCRKLYERSGRESREPAWLARLSGLSYGVYLFHWPFYVLLVTALNPLPSALLSFLLSLVLAAFSNLLWTPVFAGADSPFLPPPSQRRGWKIGVAACLCTFAVLLYRADRRAPEMMQLEKGLWTQGVMQDMDTIQTLAESGEEKAKDILAERDAALRRQRAEEERKFQESAKEDGLTIIGDSITLACRNYLIKNLPNTEVTAKDSRFFHQGVDIMKEMVKNRKIKKYVVITLGANMYPNYRKILQQYVEALPKGCHLIFMVPYDGKATESSDSTKYGKYLPEFASQYPFVTVMDWHSLALQNPQIFKGGDGTHFDNNLEGYKLFRDMIYNAVREASKQPAKS